MKRRQKTFIAYVLAAALILGQAAQAAAITSQSSDVASVTTLVSDTLQTAAASTTASAAEAPTGTGLMGEYYDNMDFTNLKLTRVDPVVNFNWSTGSPSPLIGADTFSVRWSGQVQPKFSENYTFYTRSDDGVRLWVNNQLIVNNWTPHSEVENSGTIMLEAGKKYSIKMEYYEQGTFAAAKLYWSSTSQLKEVIPQTCLYPYYDSTGMVKFVNLINGHGYALIDQPMSWPAANVYSGMLGGYLATITSPEEQMYIQSILINGSKDYYWLGLTDQQTEGTWKWVTNEEFRYTNWHAGQPDNSNNDDYCAIIRGNDWAGTASTGLWHDEKEATTLPLSSYGFICEWDDPGIDSTPPIAPTMLEAASNSLTTASLTWTASSDNVGVAGYSIYRNGAQVAAVTATSYTDMGLAPGTTYSYTVKARDNAGNESPASSAVSVTTAPDTNPPTAPSNLRVASKTGTSVSLEWAASTDNIAVTAYDIYRNNEKVASTSGTTYKDQGLSANTPYTYTVTARDGAGNTSAASSPVAAIPVMPHILRVDPANGLAIGGAVSQPLQLYFVNNGDISGAHAAFEYSTDGNNWNTVSGAVYGPYTVDSETLCIKSSWDLSAIESGSYTVRYTLYDSDQNMEQQTAVYQVDRTAPGIPASLTAAGEIGRIALAWKALSETDISHYRIYRSAETSGDFSEVGRVESKANTVYVDKNVQSGITYYYKVTAVDKFNQEGAASDTVSGIAKADTVPPTVLGIDPGEGSAIGSHAAITVRAEDNIALKSITLQYSINGGTEWTDIATIDTEGTATFQWDTATLNGEIKIRAVAWDMAGNLSSGTPVRTYTVDTQGPAKVTGVSASPGANSAVLRWNDVSDEGFSYFQIERKDTVDGEYRDTAKVESKLGINITGLTCSTTYWFRVIAYDRLGNRGVPSDEIQVTTSDDSIAPAVTSLEPGPGYYKQSIQLKGKASDNVGIAVFTFQISTDRSTWTDIATLSPEASPTQAEVTYNMDISAFPEGTYFVRGIARDSAGNISNTSSTAPFVEYRIDRTAPAQPVNLNTTPSTGCITLRWDKGAESDLAAYRVYRSNSQDGTYTLVADGVAALGYNDRAVQADTPYYYKVSAVDAAGNEGSKAGPISAVPPLDSEAPRIISVSKADGTTLPANPTINVLAADNYKLSKVTMEYIDSNSPSDGQWNLVNGKDISTYSEVATFTWNTSGLSDGTYTVRFTATDAAGNISSPLVVTYNLNIEAPQKPTLSALGGDWKVDLSWTTGNEPDMGVFRIYRSTVSGSSYKLIKETSACVYSDERLTPGRNYYYVVEAVDRYGNTSRSNEAVAVPQGRDPYPPTAEAGDSIVVVDGMEANFDGTQSSDNDRIAAYSWDFGDGSGSTLAQPSHIYSAPGNYTASLTVYDASGNSATDTVNVEVRPKETVGIMEVRILDDSSGMLISGGSLMIELPDGTMQKFSTNEYGVANVVADPGTYRVFAYKNDYKPVAENAEFTANQKTSLTIRLQKSQLVVGNISVRRMSYDEILEAGINTNDPSNQWVYKFIIVLGFVKVEYMVNGLGTILVKNEKRDDNSNNNYTSRDSIQNPTAITFVDHPEIPPSLIYMIIPGEARWLKEFFEVGVTLKNTADPQFVIDNAKVTLNLPAGLSLASTAKPQNMVGELGSIPGGESREAKWIISPDMKGSYKISAEFNGTLQPFGDEVKSVFNTEQPFKVWGDDALSISYQPQAWAEEGKPYHLMISVSNVSDIPLHELTVRIREGANYSIANGAMKAIPELQPMQTEWLDFELIPNFSGMLVLSDIILIDNPSMDGSALDELTRRYGSSLDPNTLVGDPVDSSTGAHIISAAPIMINGSAPFPFDIEYNSLLAELGNSPYAATSETMQGGAYTGTETIYPAEALFNPIAIGRGWGHSYQARLEFLSSETIIVYWNSYYKNIYFSQGNGTFKSEDLAACTDRLVRNSDGSYTLTRKDQSCYTFNQNGRLIKKGNGHGQYVVLEYDEKECPIKITEPVSGQFLTISYNQDSLINEVKDTAGRSVTFQYNDRRQLIAITTTDGKTMHFTYDSNNRILTATDNDGKRVFTNTYDSKGRVATQDDGIDGNQLTRFSYIDSTSSDDKVTVVTDRNGKTRTIVHDWIYSLVSVKDELGNTTTYTNDNYGNHTCITDARGNKTTYTYDSRGNVLTITNAAGAKITMTYDENDNLLTVEKDNGKKAVITYDENNITAITDFAGSTKRYTYDSNGLLLTTALPGQDPASYTYTSGKIHTITDPVGNINTYSYDNAGRLETITDAAGKAITYTYDNADNVIKITEPSGSEWNYSYDKRHNLLSETDARGNTTHYSYNDNGKLKSVTDAQGNRTEYQYDGEDRLIKVIDARGNATAISYDEKGRVVAITDALGNSTTRIYDAVDNIVGLKDALNRQIRSTEYDILNNPVKETDALGNAAAYRYDSYSRLLEFIGPMGDSTKYSYDELDRLISSIDAINGQSSQEYDSSGNITAATDLNSNRTSFSYDNAGRLTSETNTAGTVLSYTYNSRGLLAQSINGRGQTTSYEYDDSGRLVSFTDLTGTVSYTYDENGNTLTASDSNGTIIREYDALNRVTKYTDAKGNVIQYEYDAVGNLVILTYPGGKQVTYSYDAANRMTEVTDWAGRKTSYEYDANGRLVKTIRPDGTIQSNVYDAAGRLQQHTDTDRNGSVINKYTFSYDKGGNIISEESDYEPNTTGIKNAIMTYSSSNRLETYNGQIISYDADGNMVAGPLKNAAVNFTYDSRNRLTAAANTGYIYDAENHRIGVVENGQQTDYIVNPQAYLSQVLIKTDSQGNQTFYVYGVGLIGQEEKGVYKTYHFDYRGSTTAITDMEGVVIDRFQYGPFGELVEHTGTTVTPFQYNGSYGVMTDSNGLYYMRARYYNPEIKQFINQDTLKGNIYEGQSLNRYAYVNGNPVSYIDPLGHFAIGSYFTNPFEGFTAHDYLDGLGLIPGPVGTAASLANTYLYWREGDKVQTFLSLVGPIAGAMNAPKWIQRALYAHDVYGFVSKFAK
ncbi:MAG: PA14 domain-containing protein [Clostridia bacterium]|nr:PA14 domain-containing protein [Clostridia bacterium]